jgi:hypothetical protein
VSSYKVVFLGLAVAGPEEEARLISGLQKKFNLTPEKAERLLQRIPIVVKKGIGKEEMEKYLKAFEGIGGRVRGEVEEEVIAEPPEISAEPEPGKKPYMGRMITCPQCGFEQPETDECVKCGIIISKYVYQQEMARSVEGQVREISPEDKYVPWESGEGFISAFLRTTWGALFSPTRFFKKVGNGEGYWSAFIYGVISGIIGLGGTLLWQWFLFSQWFPVQKFSDLLYSVYFVILTFAIPLMVAFSIYFGTAVTHLCLMIVGGNKKGFQKTFRVISYAFSGNLFGIIPFIGSTIGGIYILILTILGVREGHGISTGRAVLAVFLPIMVGVGVTVLAVIFLRLFFGTLGFFGGVGV